MNKPWSLFCTMSILTIFFAGCATTNNVKQFQSIETIRPGKALVYVYSGKKSNIYEEILVKDHAVGVLNSREYVAFLCDPGPLTVSTGWGTDLHSVNITAEKGQRYYIRVNSSYRVGRQVLSLGLMPDKWDIIPEIVPEEQALEEMKQCSQGSSNNGYAKVESKKMIKNAETDAIKKLFIDIGEKDWETSPFLAEGLKARGYDVKTGLKDEMPSDTQGLVKVQENWFWDLGKYLLELSVEITNPQTKDTYASAKVRRAVVQGRRGPKIMSTEAMDLIFHDGIPPGIEFVN